MSIINKRIGIVGGGQLGKMMILEAKRLGFYVTVLEPAKDCPAHSICDEHIVSDFDNPAGYFELAQKSDVITYEFEHINAAALEELEKSGHLVYPSVTSLKTIQNKFTQKTALRQNNIPVPRFESVSSIPDIRRLNSKDDYGFPLMLKAATGGYDGKGNALIKDESDIEAAFNALSRANGNSETALMAEEFVDFETEVSVIACRGIDGKSVIYPVAENIHKNSILDTTIVPARINVDLLAKAAEVARKVMDVFEGVGTFCVELFVTKSGEIYVNEVAPRPHNSGHYTIEGCFANQFENHIRAITGLPLGDASLIQPSVMVNLLGGSDGVTNVTGIVEAYCDSKVHVHLYGKSDSKKGRKMGHFTVVDNDLASAVNRAERLKKIVLVNCPHCPHKQKCEAGENEH